MERGRGREREREGGRERGERELLPCLYLLYSMLHLPTLIRDDTVSQVHIQLFEIRRLKPDLMCLGVLDCQFTRHK